MKPKVLTVQALDGDNLFFNPQLVHYEFRRKIDTRLSILRNQLKVTRRRDSSLSAQKSKPKINLTKVLPQDTDEDSKFFKEDFTPAELLPYVDTAMKLQQNAYEVVMATNRAFSIQLLLIFLEAFIAFIFNFYYMIAVIAEPQRFKLPQGESIGYLSQHLIQPCMCIIITVVSFSLIQAEFKRSQKVVNKIIIYAESDSIRSRFLAFSQQIQTNVPDFTVFGFFSLDGSVLFSMVSATTTYLIILIQTIGEDSDDLGGLPLPKPITLTTPSPTDRA